MDSSNAEKADWRDRNVGPYNHITDTAYAEWLRKFPSDQSPVTYQAIAFGVFATLALDAASRDAEVADLTRLLAESRARFGDSEARRAELEAAVAAVRKLATGPVPTVDEWWPLLRSIAETASASLSVVLEDRDREVEARALEDFAVRAERMFAGTDGTDKERAWIGGVKAVALRLRQRAAAIRKGDTNA